MKIRSEDAIRHFKTVAALAALLKISRPAIYQWGEFVPESREYQIHVLSGAVLPRADVPPAPGEQAAVAG